MSTFEEIQGKNIRSLSSDPSPVAAGDMWYNSTTQLLKGRVFQTAAWVSGGNLNTARSQLTQGGTLIVPGYAKGQAGTQTAAIVWGGAYPGPNTTPATESWNGSSWTAGNVLGSSMYYSGSAGTQTAALAFGGNFPTLPGTSPGRKVVQSWDGTSWTDSPSSINNYRAGTMSGGIQTAAFLTGGDSPTGSKVSETEVYDGSSWSISPASLATARATGAGAGVSNISGIVAGGNTPANSNATEEFTGAAFVTKTFTTS